MVWPSKTFCNLEQSENVTREIKRVPPLPQKHCPHRPTKISFENRKNALIDVRKEKCIGVSLRPVLAPQSQMVAPDEALPARANIRIPIIISQFHGLIHPTVTVSQVGRLRFSKVSSKAFLSAGLASAGCNICDHILFDNSQSDSVCKVHKATIRENPLRTLPRNDNLYLIGFQSGKERNVAVGGRGGKGEKSSR